MLRVPPPPRILNSLQCCSTHPSPLALITKLRILQLSCRSTRSRSPRRERSRAQSDREHSDRRHPRTAEFRDRSRRSPAEEGRGGDKDTGGYVPRTRMGRNQSVSPDKGGPSSSLADPFAHLRKHNTQQYGGEWIRRQCAGCRSASNWRRRYSCCGSRYECMCTTF